MNWAYIGKFLSAFASMLDVSPRPHKPIQAPPLERGIGRHFEAAFGYIQRAMDKQKGRQD